MKTLDKVDAIVTDPPYGIGESGATNKGRSKLATSKDYGNKNWDNKTVDAEVEYAISISKHQIIFGGNYYMLPPTSCWLVWDKENGKNDFADCELAWTNLKKATRLLKWRWQGMLQKNMGHKKEERVHPTQKPVGVMEWCITHLPKEVVTTCDPFMGSGTTLVACAKMGRKGIGIELDPDYFEIACERVRKAYEQPDMFVAAPKAKPEQDGFEL
jgi:DNA modification methylase